MLRKRHGSLVHVWCASVFVCMQLFISLSNELSDRAFMRLPLSLHFLGKIEVIFLH